MFQARVFLITVIMFFLAACDNKLSSNSLSELPQLELYKLAQNNLVKENYSHASEYFSELNKRFPFAKHSEKNRILGIYAYFKNKDYVLSYIESDYFLQLYPHSKYFDWVMFMQAYSKYNENRSYMQNYLGSDPARNDTSNLQQAYEVAQSLINLRPQSKYVVPAIAMQQRVTAILAKQDIDIANIYYTKGAYVAASHRAADILHAYPGSCFIPDAVNILQQSYKELGLNSWVSDISRYKSNSVKTSS